MPELRRRRIAAAVAGGGLSAAKRWRRTSGDCRTCARRLLRRQLRLLLTSAVAADRPLLLTSGSEGVTRELGAALAGVLQPGDVVGLTGDLGAGKTRLVQGVAAGLGVSDQITSPTFVLMHEHEGSVRLHHLDAYRLDRARDLEDLGLDAVFDPDAVVLVEWADRVLEAMPLSWLELSLRLLDGDDRDIEVVFRGAPWIARRGAVERALAAFRAA